MISLETFYLLYFILLVITSAILLFYSFFKYRILEDKLRTIKDIIEDDSFSSPMSLPAYIFKHKQSNLESKLQYIKDIIEDDDF